MSDKHDEEAYNSDRDNHTGTDNEGDDDDNQWSQLTDIGHLKMEDMPEDKTVEAIHKARQLVRSWEKKRPSVLNLLVYLDDPAIPAAGRGNIAAQIVEAEYESGDAQAVKLLGIEMFLKRNLKGGSTCTPSISHPWY